MLMNWPFLALITAITLVGVAALYSVAGARSSLLGEPARGALLPQPRSALRRRALPTSASNWRSALFCFFVCFVTVGVAGEAARVAERLEVQRDHRRRRRRLRTTGSRRCSTRRRGRRSRRRPRGPRRDLRPCSSAAMAMPPLCETSATDRAGAATARRWRSGATGDAQAVRADEPHPGGAAERGEALAPLPSGGVLEAGGEDQQRLHALGRAIARHPLHGRGRDRDHRQLDGTRHVAHRLTRGRRGAAVRRSSRGGSRPRRRRRSRGARWRRRSRSTPGP